MTTVINYFLLLSSVFAFASVMFLGLKTIKLI